MLIGLAQAASAAPRHKPDPPPVVPAAARFAAFSMGRDPRVAKLAVTFGATSWYYDVRGEKLYRAQAAGRAVGGGCGRWAVARVDALDRWGNNLYGQTRVLMQRHRESWIGRMLGHGFPDVEVLKIGVDRKSLECLRASGM